MRQSSVRKSSSKMSQRIDWLRSWVDWLKIRTQEMASPVLSPHSQHIRKFYRSPFMLTGFLERFWFHPSMRDPDFEKYVGFRTDNCGKGVARGRWGPEEEEEAEKSANIPSDILGKNQIQQKNYCGKKIFDCSCWNFGDHGCYIHQECASSSKVYNSNNHVFNHTQ